MLGYLSNKPSIENDSEIATMTSAPRIWLQYRPVRIGWVIPDRDIAHVATAVSWNSCLWGGGFNPVIPIDDLPLADALVKVFRIDLLLTTEETEATQSFVKRFPYLEHNRWHRSIFEQRNCAFADVRHIARQIVKHQDKRTETALIVPIWDTSDPLHQLLTLSFGRYPAPSEQIADYKGGMRKAFDVPEKPITNGDEIPSDILDGIGPLLLTGYDMTRTRDPSGWLQPAIVFGSVTDFDDIALFWNLRAAGAAAVFFDQAYAGRLTTLTNGFLDKLRNPISGRTGSVSCWVRQQVDTNWQPGLDLSGLQVSIQQGRDRQSLWNGLNIQPTRPQFSTWHRDVVPSYHAGGTTPTASFALPDRPFDDGDVQSLNQKFVVVVDAAQFGEEGDFTFETPFAPQMNEFYGRHFYHDHDAVRAEAGSLEKGAAGIITSISTQRLTINAYRTFDWLTHFLRLCNLKAELSEPGLRCKRLIMQLGGLQDCRVLKIRGVRNLLRKYGVDESFTRTAAIEAIRDVDPVTGAVGLDAFKNLHIEFRSGRELKPDDVLKYLLTRRVFRVGLELKCPNCELPSWMHLDDIRSNSICTYCDHTYDITPQLKDRDWRYRRSGIFGRDDHQLGGVPVAVTLQQLFTALHDSLIMFSTAMHFTSAEGRIEPCEADFVGVVAGALGADETPIQLLFGEAKTSKPIDEQDIRKLGKLADAIPKDLAQAFILFAKTDTFSAQEVRLAKSLNSEHRRRVILWSRDELEPYFVYERSADRLGGNQYATTLTDMANITHQLWFSEA